MVLCCFSFFAQKLAVMQFCVYLKADSTVNNTVYWKIRIFYKVFNFFEEFGFIFAVSNRRHSEVVGLKLLV